MAKIRLRWDTTENRPTLAVKLKKGKYHTFKANQRFRIKFPSGTSWPGKGWGRGNNGTGGGPGGGPVTLPSDKTYDSGDTPAGSGEYEIRIFAPTAGSWNPATEFKFDVLMVKPGGNPATNADWEAWDPRVIPD